MFIRPMAFVVALVLPNLLIQPQTRSETALERIYREYQVARNQSDVGALVRLDQQLRALVPYWQWEGSPATAREYRPGFEAMGVQPLLFEPELVGYSGKLLREAHAIDPRSHRQFTLYSTIFGPDGETGTTPPAPDAAERYLSEFPKGPFAFQAHLALGTFQSDLFHVIQDEEAGDKNGDKYDCYSRYLTREPLPIQRTRAQAAAITHLGALAQLRPDVQEIADWLAEARQGHVEGWHYCGD